VCASSASASMCAGVKARGSSAETVSTPIARDCHGIGTAAIDPISDRALAELAQALAPHPAWRFTVEGHTDSVGTDAANQTLSTRRAEAVRARLAERHRVDTRRWGAVGYGATRPRESNATIEGRARNRRVELVRDCG